MITVIVYTLNDQGTIAWCLSSLVTQRSGSGHEVVVIDDASSDQTATIVARAFPQFRLVREEHTIGWVASLRKHLPTFQGSLLAFLGAHCRADEGWLAAVEDEGAKGDPVFTGTGHHGKHRLLERFHAISVHGDYVGQAEGEVEFLWDDNFAIRAGLLEGALPESDVILSDGAGAILVSRNLHKMGISIAYRPSLSIDHRTHSLGQMTAMWYGEMAVNSIAIKLADPSSPGAGLLRLGPIAAAALAAKRLLQGVGSMYRARRWLHIPLLELGFHTCLLSLLMPAYFLGLCRQLFLNRGRIW